MYLVLVIFKIVYYYAYATKCVHKICRYIIESIYYIIAVDERIYHDDIYALQYSFDICYIHVNV